MQFFRNNFNEQKTIVWQPFDLMCIAYVLEKPSVFEVILWVKKWAPGAACENILSRKCLPNV